MKSITAYIAKVVEQFPEEDTIDVVFIRGNHCSIRAKVIHSKANPLYGKSGDLPDVGEIGIVLALYDYGQEFYWIGSYHDSCDNPCTNDPTEIGRSLFHHESDVYHQILPDGTFEFSHPSGTFFKLGGVSLNLRKRFRKLEGTYNQRVVEDYDNRQSDPVQLTLCHTWINGNSSSSIYPLDARKNQITGDIKHTYLYMDQTGTVQLNHETVNGTQMTVTISPQGNTVVESNNITLKGINGVDTAVTIQGTLHATNWIKSDTDVIGNMVYDANGTKSMLAMRNAYNPHVHGTSPGPNPTMG